MTPAAVEIARWNRLCAAAQLAGDSASWYARIIAFYSEPHRHYHTLRHLSDCLGEFDAARHFASAPVAVEFGLWFHDATYDTHAHDNEERSAELAVRCFSGAGVQQELTTTVSNLILATKHTSAATIGDEALIVDIDLAILGQREERFDEYEREIRAEYAWVPETVFRSKRREILQGFLRRERIYATDWFAQRYERQARRNIERSLAKLARA